MEQNRITIPQWQGIKAGQEVETGFPGIVLTAPSEPGEYTLYECAEGNTHAGTVDISDVLDHEEAEPFEASAELESDLDAEAWTELYSQYLGE